MFLWRARNQVLYKIPQMLYLADLYKRPICHVFKYNAGPGIIINLQTRRVQYGPPRYGPAYIYDVATGTMTVYHPV